MVKLARLPNGADVWERAITVADVPNRFEGNPVLFTVPDGRVWLFFVVIEPASPRNVQIMFLESRDEGRRWTPLTKFVTKPGIRTRNHPIVLDNGEILFPLHDQVAGGSVFLISKDQGQTWDPTSVLRPPPSHVQPTVISRGNGNLYALFRSWSPDPEKRFLLQSESLDFGRTWAPLTLSKVPTVSSAIEMIRLKNGNVVLGFNNARERLRSPLNLALSTDGAKTWEFDRALETEEGEFSYPSLIQTRDEHIHIVYTFRRQTIKHVEVNEDWIRESRGDAARANPRTYQ